MTVKVFPGATPCHCLSGFLRFERITVLSLHGQGVQKGRRL